MDATDDVFTITPRSPLASAGCTLIFAAARRIALKVPIKLIFTARSKLASAWGPLRPITRSPGATPAQFTRPWIAPKADTHRSRAACADASSVTSALMKRTVPPRKPAMSLPAGSFRSAMTTLPPFAASIAAVAAPRPEPPPVTRKTWFWICMSGVFSCWRHSHRNDRQVVLARPFFPVIRVVRGEQLAQRIDGDLAQGEALGEASREVRLERGDRHPSRARRVEIIASGAAAQQRALACESLVKRLGEHRGGVGERGRLRRTLAGPVARNHQRERGRHRALGTRHVREERRRHRRRRDEAVLGEIGEVVAGALVIGRRMAGDGDVAEARTVFSEPRT